MTQISSNKSSYLLSIEEIPADGSSFPAYFAGSTAPNNVEDLPDATVKNPKDNIQKIATFLCAQKNPEILIAVHGYNTALGDFSSADIGPTGRGVKGWYQQIRNHIVQHCHSKSEGLVFIGYRWPSEQINGTGQDSLGNKLEYAQQSLPVVLKVVSFLAIALLFGLSLVALTGQLTGSVLWSVVGMFLVIVATLFLSFVFTLFVLRIVGYFRDTYRASNFGVPDLVELIRQIDKAVMAVTPHGSARPRIKLSFIGHSMGGFVVTNTVRILSDVFDPQSIGSLGSISNSQGEAKLPSADIGNVFSLGRLVLVSPDIPAETIISGRANYLSSSLRRFEETYLFSNEGDMALKLASTAANYASFPANTREGGYRLGNVVVRSPQAPEGSPRYGILNFDTSAPEGGALVDVQERAHGGFEPQQTVEKNKENCDVTVSTFLQYLYILRAKSLSRRQQEIIEPDQKPIAELFTVFDCTDYCEVLLGALGKGPKEVGLLTRALGKPALSFWDYVGLTVDMFTGKIDTHGGYFYAGQGGPGAPSSTKPEARVTKQLIYGLACLGFQSFLETLSEPLGPDDGKTQQAAQKGRLRSLSALCAKSNIQALLATERYNRDILMLPANEKDRKGY